MSVTTAKVAITVIQGGERENVPRPINRQLNAPAKPMPTPAAIRGTRRATAATNVLPLAMHARSIPVCKVPNVVLRTVDQFLDVIFNCTNGLQGCG